MIPNQTTKEIADLITLEDLPEDLKDIARIIGIEAVQKLVSNWSGYVYFPKLTHMEQAQNKFIVHKIEEGKSDREIVKLLREGTGRGFRSAQDLIKKVKFNLAS